MRWGNSLMAYEEDIKNRSLLDWLKAHTSGFKPLHRYEGVFELCENKIVFDGKDVKEIGGFVWKYLSNLSRIYILDGMKYLRGFP